MTEKAKPKKPRPRKPAKKPRELTEDERKKYDELLERMKKGYQLD